MATEDARYRQSTQYRLWSYSPAQLSDLRSKTNALARANISERLSSSSGTPTSLLSGNNTPNPASSGASTAPADVDSLAQAQPPPLPEFLTPTEEVQLLAFYTVELLRAAAFVELPTDIRATAAVFLRRFYVTNSIMTYPPTELLKTCLFFGSKAEGFYTRLNRFAENFPNTTGEEILAGEFLLCQGIRFAFDVKHPYRSLEGAIMELKRYEDMDEKRIMAAHSRARDILKFSPLVTDAYFHYTPSQIMLAALSLADRGLVEKLFQETFHHAPAPSESEASTPAPNGNSTPKPPGAADKEEISGAEVRDKVMGAVEACREMLAAEPPERMKEYWGTPESNKIIKPLIKKLKKCRDPDRWNLVALQKARREVTAQKEDGSAKKKSAGEDDGTVFDSSADSRDAKRRKVSSEDPFGPPL